MSADVLNASSVPSRQTVAPHVILYNQDNQKLVEGLETAERHFHIDPSGFLSDIRGIAEDPRQGPDGSLWRMLTEHETALDYGFDPVTEATVAADALYRRLRAHGSPDMRSRKVSIFLSRVIQFGEIGKTTLEE